MRSPSELLPLLPLLPLLAVLACGPASAPPRASTGVATAVRLPSLDAVAPLEPGSRRLSEEVAGRVAVLDLWATWCAPCRASMPKVARLAEAYAQTDLVVAGVHVGPSASAATRYVDEAGLRYSMHIDPQFAFTDAVGGRKVPLLLVVDRGGTIVHRTHELDRETLAIVRGLLGG